MMDFYFPDSQDQIDPGFDFIREEHPAFHVRQRDDVYAHEALDHPGFDGLLLSKGIVDGVRESSGRYTMAQCHRLYRIGVRRFFRLPPQMKTLGDCGAFSYIEDDEPPIGPDEAIDFYEGCQLDAGVSVDHVILAFRSEQEVPLIEEEEGLAWRRRQKITLEYAAEFLRRHRVRRSSFEPVGVAQGWSPSSYAHSVNELQRMGYSRIALGGMVPLKTHQVMEVLSAVSEVRNLETQLHLLGVTRTESLEKFRHFGVTSFDSTSPFRQAFMDDRNNYHWPGGHYTAIRVPSADGNAKLKRRIKSGEVDQRQALQLEAGCLERLRALDGGWCDDVDGALDLLSEYHALFDQAERVGAYRRMLEDQPWKECPCGICSKVGVEVAIFRGTERNKRRGFHNIAMFGQQLPECVGSDTRRDEEGV